MDILAYGEDALTLWSLTHRLPAILEALGDASHADHCQVLFRPSFGRSGGPHNSQFGEFDFILLARQRLYLGESKWQRSSEKIQAGVLTLRHEQMLRHKLFKFYVDAWAFGDYATWSDFAIGALPNLRALGIFKPIAPAGSLLASNLQTVLGIIKKHYLHPPEIHNVLLYLHRSLGAEAIPVQAGDDFLVVPMDYTEVASDNFIRLSVQGAKETP